MRSAQHMSLKLLSVLAVLVGAASLAACGGGGAEPQGTTLLVGGPVMGQPPGSTLPDPIPMPEGDPLPIEPVPPEQPPAEPPAEPPHEDPPADPPAVPAPDLARVSALALVGENASVAEDASVYAGLYVGDDDGGIWRRSLDGDWRQVGTAGVAGSIEAMAYVPTLHALYLVIENPVRGALLARWLLTPTPMIVDTSVDPAVVLDEGGVQFQLLKNAADEERLDNGYGARGLAFDTDAQVLYVWAGGALLHLEDLEVAEATLDHRFNLADGLLADAQDMAFNRQTGRLVLADAWQATVIELDHLGLAFHQQAAIEFSDVRALAIEDDGTRVAVDRATAALVRFDNNGAVIP